MPKIVLCHRKNGCCPTIDIKDDQVIFENDDGECCTLSLDQFELLKQKIKNNEL